MWHNVKVVSGQFVSTLRYDVCFNCYLEVCGEEGLQLLVHTLLILGHQRRREEVEETVLLDRLLDDTGLSLAAHALLLLHDLLGDVLA